MTTPTAIHWKHLWGSREWIFHPKINDENQLIIEHAEAFDPKRDYLVLENNTTHPKYQFEPMLGIVPAWASFHRESYRWMSNTTVRKRAFEYLYKAFPELGKSLVCAFSAKEESALFAWRYIGSHLAENGIQINFSLVFPNSHYVEILAMPIRLCDAVAKAAAIEEAFRMKRGEWEIRHIAEHAIWKCGIGRPPFQRPEKSDRILIAEFNDIVQKFLKKENA